MLARGLVGRGHEVTLFAHADSHSAGRLVPWPGRSSRSRLDTARNSATLTHRVVSERLDIVHSFSRLAYLAPILPARLPKLMSYQRAISPRTTAFANRVAFGSLEFTGISRWMISAAPLAGRWHVVPNGVPLDVYDFRADPGADAPLVFLGRIEQIKGAHLAIEVARRARVPLVIAGNIPGSTNNSSARRSNLTSMGRWFDILAQLTTRRKTHCLGTRAPFSCRSCGMSRSAS